MWIRKKQVISYIIFGFCITIPAYFIFEYYKFVALEKSLNKNIFTQLQNKIENTPCQKGPEFLLSNAFDKIIVGNFEREVSYYLNKISKKKNIRPHILHNHWKPTNSTRPSQGYKVNICDEHVCPYNKSSIIYGEFELKKFNLTCETRVNKGLSGRYKYRIIYRNCRNKKNEFVLFKASTFFEGPIYFPWTWYHDASGSRKDRGFLKSAYICVTGDVYGK